MKQTNRAQPARIDGIALIVTDGVLERVEPARNQWIDHRYGITGFGERGRPVEMKQARGFDEHEQLLWIVYLPLNRGEQLAQSCRLSGQVLFKEHMLRSIA
jgi:hypothetical protein